MIQNLLYFFYFLNTVSIVGIGYTYITKEKTLKILYKAQIELLNTTNENLEQVLKKQVDNFKLQIQDTISYKINEQNRTLDNFSHYRIELNEELQRLKERNQDLENIIILKNNEIKKRDSMILQRDKKIIKIKAQEVQ